MLLDFCCALLVVLRERISFIEQVQRLLIFQSQRMLSQLQTDLKNMAAAMVDMLRDSKTAPASNAKPLAPTVIFISGATGTSAGFFNGLYDPTGEKSSDGRVLYKNRFDPTTVIEHFGGKWQVKDISSIGNNRRLAEVPGCCPFEVCKWNVWLVKNGEAMEEQPNVKMVSGAEAEAQASTVCIVLSYTIALYSTASSPTTSQHRNMSLSPSFLFTRAQVLSLTALGFFVCRPPSTLPLLQPTIPEPRPSS
jgi:hypothetical protein